LFLPIHDDFASEELFGPLVHLFGDRLGHSHERGILGDGELEIALIVQGHGTDLSEGVFSIEHPTVCSGQERVSDVAQAAFQGRMGFRARSCSLYPLSL